MLAVLVFPQRKYASIVHGKVIKKMRNQNDIATNRPDIATNKSDLSSDDLDKILTCKSETKTVKVITIEAEQGPAGPQGEQGVPGPQGLNGAAGPAGPAYSLPVYDKLEDFPLDGSVVLAIFRPPYGLYYGANGINQALLFIGDAYRDKRLVTIFTEVTQDRSKLIQFNPPDGWSLLT